MPARSKVAAVQDGAQEETPEQARKTALRKAYGVATQRLREAHGEEFQALYVAAAQELGVEYKPRLTPEARAAEEFDRLLEQYPFLGERLANPEGAQMADSAP